MKIFLNNTKITFKKKEISDFTKNAIIASGNTNMSEAQKDALDKFFHELGYNSNDGVSTKIDYLFIPFISKDLQHSMVNYKNNEVIVPDDSTYLFNGRGIVGNVGGNVPLVVSQAYNLDFTNFSALYCTEIGDSGLNKFRLVMATGTSSFRLLEDGSSAVSAIQATDTNGRTVSVMATKSTKQTYGVNFVGQSLKAYIGQSSLLSKATTFESNTLSKPLIINSIYSGVHAPSDTTITFLAIGKSINEDEFTKAYNAMLELKSVFIE